MPNNLIKYGYSASEITAGKNARIAYEDYQLEDINPYQLEKVQKEVKN